MLTLRLENIGEDHTAVRIRMRMFRGDWNRWRGSTVVLRVDDEDVLETTVKDSSFPYGRIVFSALWQVAYSKLWECRSDNSTLGISIDLTISLKNMYDDVTRSQFYFDQFTKN